jgi:hypothetical protein
METRQTIIQSESSQLVVAERRAWVRYSCGLTASCQPIAFDAEVLWPARIQDLSAGGLALLATRPFELGALLNIEIQLSNKGFLEPNLVHVVNVTADRHGGWRISCAFLHPLTEPQLQSLLSPTPCRLPKGGSLI